MGWGLPGSPSNPVHLGGGFNIQNMDAFALTIGALVVGVMSLVLATAALVIAVLACIRASPEVRERLHGRETYYAPGNEAAIAVDDRRNLRD
ncbi:hypothetical protein T484DRAFT_1885444 [Baffinella frigidus]|nr:hypothetical protein T484DRAFT_1885444 [Cryptophyta sp. CCMP2293]